MAATPNRTMRIPDDPWKPALAEAAKRDETLTSAVIAFLRRYVKGES